jgi:hypothetical protein
VIVMGCYGKGCLISNISMRKKNVNNVRIGGLTIKPRTTVFSLFF